MMKRIDFNLVFALGVLTLLLGPYIYLSNYNLPSFDDYSIPHVIHQRGFLETQWFWYTTWGGRYAASAIISIVNPMVYSTSGINYYGTISLLMIVLFSITLFRFLSSLLPNASLSIKLGAMAGLLFAYFFKMPTPTEAFYWLVGAWTYTLGTIVALELGANLINNLKAPSRGKFIYSIVLFGILAGTNELIVLLFFGIYALVISLDFFKRRKIEKIHIIFLSIFLVFTLVSFLAPGNSVRSTYLEEAGWANRNLPEAISMTIKLGISKVFHWAMLSPFLLIAVLALTIKEKLRSDLFQLVDNWLKFAYWFLASNAFVFLLIFPVVWSEGSTPDRVYNPIALYFLVANFINVFLLFHLLKVKPLEIPFLAKLLIVCFLAGHTLASQNRISRAWIEIRSGEAKAYYADMDEVFKLCKANPGKALVLKPMDHRPNTIFINDLERDSTHWFNRYFCEYHGIRSIYVDDIPNHLVKP